MGAVLYRRVSRPCKSSTSGHGATTLIGHGANLVHSMLHLPLQPPVPPSPKGDTSMATIVRRIGKDGQPTTAPKCGARVYRRSLRPSRSSPMPASGCRRQRPLSSKAATLRPLRRSGTPSAFWAAGVGNQTGRTTAARSSSVFTRGRIMTFISHRDFWRPHVTTTGRCYGGVREGGAYGTTKSDGPGCG